jgi:hypothetical protein
VRGSRPTETILLQQTLTLPLSLGRGEATQARRGATAEAIHSESVLDLRHAHRAFASPLEQGERIKVRGSESRRHQIPRETLTLPLSLGKGEAIHAREQTCAESGGEQSITAGIRSNPLRVSPHCGAARRGRMMMRLHDAIQGIVPASGPDADCPRHAPSLCLTNSVRFVNLK